MFVVEFVIDVRCWVSDFSFRSIWNIVFRSKNFCVMSLVDSNVVEPKTKCWTLMCFNQWPTGSLMWYSLYLDFFKPSSGHFQRLRIKKSWILNFWIFEKLFPNFKGLINIEMYIEKRNGRKGYSTLTFFSSLAHMTRLGLKSLATHAPD